MAKRIELLSGSLMAGEPMLYRVWLDDVVVPEGKKLDYHTLVVRVHAQLSDDFINRRSYPFSFDVTDNDNGYYDIDFSVFANQFIKFRKFACANIEGKHYIPFVLMDFEAWDVISIDGIKRQSTETLEELCSKLIPGSYRERDRVLNTPVSNTITSENLTTKPSTPYPEVVFAGGLYVLPEVSDPPVLQFPLGQGGSIASVATPITTTGNQTIGGRSVYAVDMSENPDAFEFQFVNRYGVVESYCIETDKTVSIKYQRAHSIRPAQETFSNTSRTLARTISSAEYWEMSSGPLTREWRDWFVHDFLAAERAWVKLTPYNSDVAEPVWVPCLFEIDGKYNMSSDLAHDGLSVNFNLILCTDGYGYGTQKVQVFQFDVTSLDNDYPLMM